YISMLMLCFAPRIASVRASKIFPLGRSAILCPGRSGAPTVCSSAEEKARPCEGVRTSRMKCPEDSRLRPRRVQPIAARPRATTAPRRAFFIGDADSPGSGDRASHWSESAMIKTRFEAELIEGHKGVTVVIVPFNLETAWSRKPVRLDSRRDGWLVAGT